MHSISLLDGTVLQSAELSDAGAPDRNFEFDAAWQDQRGALNLVDGTVYATFAAFLGDDLGEYHGWLVGCEADDLKVQYFLPTTRTVLGGGCWGPGGAAAASDGSLFIATGNAMWKLPQPDPDGSLLKERRKEYFAAQGGQSPAAMGDYFLSVLRIKKSRRSARGRRLVPARLRAPTRRLPPGSRLPIEADDAAPGAGRQGPGFRSSSCLILPEIDGRRLVLVSTKGFVILYWMATISAMRGTPSIPSTCSRAEIPPTQRRRTIAHCAGLSICRGRASRVLDRWRRQRPSLL